jgi:hypothetical protein
MLDDLADRPQLVPPQVFMAWKENWCFSGVDPIRGTAMVWHLSMRPCDGEGIFTCKFDGPDLRVRYVGRHAITPQIGLGSGAATGVGDGKLSFDIVEPHRVFALTYVDDDIEVKCLFTARFATFDFADGNLAPGESSIGDLGRHVFPFNHYEQSLEFRATIRRPGTNDLELTGRGNRDHSWGWRDDFGFRSHQWICANFDDCYVQASTMVDTTYPHRKFGGFVSTESGNDPVTAIDLSSSYWDEPLNEPLPEFDHDVPYTITTASGRQIRLTAHLSDRYRILYLNARHPDRSQVYQDAQIFCPFTLNNTGATGFGLLELGKHLEGEGIADRVGRR